MCGRFTLHLADLSRLVSLLGVARSLVPEWRPRYNIAPTQLAPVIVLRGDHVPERTLELLRFGLVPPGLHGASHDRGKAPAVLINARVETVAELRSFRAAFRRRRCLVPATGFFEWQPIPGMRAKQPQWVHPADAEIMTFAGIFEPAVSADGEVVSTFAIVTTEATPQLRAIHDRMPLILTPEGAERWMASDSPSAEALGELAHDTHAIALSVLAVNPAVGSPHNDDPRCIEPAPPRDPTDLGDPQLDLFGR